MKPSILGKDFLCVWACQFIGVCAWVRACVCVVCVCLCVRVCVRACVRASMHACVRASVHWAVERSRAAPHHRWSKRFVPAAQVKDWPGGRQQLAPNVGPRIVATTSTTSVVIGSGWCNCQNAIHDLDLLFVGEKCKNGISLKR